MFAQSTNLFFKSICGKKFSWKVVFEWMDKITKSREKILFTHEVQCINTKKTLVRDMYATDVHYYLNCWLGVTVKYRPAGTVQ